MIDVVTVDGDLNNVDFLYAFLSDEKRSSFDWFFNTALKELLPREARERVQVRP